MKVLYKGAEIPCYAMISNSETKRVVCLLAKRDTRLSGARTVSTLLEREHQELDYMHPSIALDTRLADSYRWFDKSLLELIGIETNSEGLFLLKEVDKE